jgi:hypothetical protein
MPQEAELFMNQVEKLLQSLEPQEAADQAAVALKRLLPLLDEEGRSRFLMTLLGDSGDDKLSSMVHL